jgi:membrane protease YdiL (CAAX protease family)
MITQSFYACILSIAVTGVLQSSIIVMHSLKKRTLGAIIFFVALVPAVLSPSIGVAKTFGLGFVYHPIAMIATTLLSITIATINWYSAGTKANMAIYPQIRQPIWGITLTLKSAIAWTVYLTAYEIIFRGVFLYASVTLIGFWPAVFLNVALYSLAHLLKNKREALLSIPFGFITIYLTWISGSCWYAVVLHVILALSHEWSSIRSNPDMRFDFSLNPKS